MKGKYIKPYGELAIYKPNETLPEFAMRCINSFGNECKAVGLDLIALPFDQYQAFEGCRWYRITFKDSTPAQEVTGVSPKQLRQQYSAYPIDKITRLRRKK